ncbi:efflux RND transporter periplasmic adaptor subunit [Sphingobacterium rhinopitheci]|uniref:efflux RND transporter periplasmic adaptor subunit n=1 Tax=Sphingobacterium rhinopitheci TaxID=2781960 RepID=UPI001F51BF52|nr:efflux RND transporter periplasmic adaptor subunit [Sphingobacterium rhinopitheci]MCI0921336.1 efflux RND transporter periplasmic adaptor subunit [Sphingobacterium rhinopitheci]
MKLSKYILYYLMLPLVLISCNAKQESNSADAHNEEEEHEEVITITELTPEQLTSVGIEVGIIEMMNISNTAKINGVLRVPNNNKAIVAAFFGGTINSVNVQEGDYVKKGQVIASITNPEYINTQEQYLMVKNQISYAEQEFVRQQELFDNGAGAKKNLQSAGTQLKDLRTQQAALTKRLQLMGINVNTISNSNIRNGMTIVSPISGVVSNITAQIGAYVDVSSHVAEIIDNAAIHLDLQVFEKDIANIMIGQLVNFTLTNNPNKIYNAKVYKIGSSFENDSKTISVHCSIQGDKKGLIDGMTIVGRLNLGDNMLMAVPNTAIVDADGKSYIFVKTDKEIEEKPHVHVEGEEHAHDEEETKNGNIRFEKIEIVKGISDLGYTAITPVVDLPKNTVIVTKGSFFVNAKMNNTGEHEH